MLPAVATGADAVVGVIVVGAGSTGVLITAACDVKVRPMLEVDGETLELVGGESWELVGAVVTRELVCTHSLTELVGERVAV